METFLAEVPLVGWAPIVVLGALTLLCLVIAVVIWRRRRVWRWVLVLAFLMFGLATAADAVNNQFSYFDNMADFIGVPTYPTVNGATVTPGETHPNGAVVSISVPDTASHFGAFDANVWLPPQYFTDPRAHFPVIYLLHGNPGDNTAWLTALSAAPTGLSIAQSGHPTILVMPMVLQNPLTGDSLCVDTQSQGNAETYIVRDVVTAVDKQLRTNSNANGRGVGGYSMGGFCSLNLGLKHPEVFSVAVDISGETVASPDFIEGGNQALFGGADWQKQVDANSPAKYVSNLNGAKGPAIWMDVGLSDPDILSQMRALTPQLQSRGFTVALHTRPGGHDAATWTSASRTALPWAAGLLAGG